MIHDISWSPELIYHDIYILRVEIITGNRFACLHRYMPQYVVQAML